MGRPRRQQPADNDSQNVKKRLNEMKKEIIERLEKKEDITIYYERTSSIGAFFALSNILNHMHDCPIDMYPITVLSSKNFDERYGTELDGLIMGNRNIKSRFRPEAIHPRLAGKASVRTAIARMKKNARSQRNSPINGSSLARINHDHESIKNLDVDNLEKLLKMSRHCHSCLITLINWHDSAQDEELVDGLKGLYSKWNSAERAQRLSEEKIIRDVKE